jgi:hypothetical protein
MDYKIISGECIDDMYAFDGFMRFIYTFLM